MKDRRTLSLLRDEIIADNFAGGGGASTGIELALGRPVDVAVNHDPEAIALHRANHPETTHYCESVFKVDPEAITGNQPVGLAWFSPDCKHFSKAKGGAPKSPRVRGLAWVVIRWARRVKPRVIMLENVEEFADWGPLLDDGSPCPVRKGTIFRLWLNQLIGAGYRVEYRVLRACDFGAPTIRRRLFVIARRDGLPIVWPKPTHGPGRDEPYRTAAECIDWSIPCPSIFGRERPLAPATMRRIAAGIRRYVIEAARPFIVPVTHQGDERVHGLGEPLRTVTTAKRGEFALVAPFLAPRYGERPGQVPRAQSVDAPIPTIVPTENGSRLVAAFLAKHYGGNETPGWPVDKPISTVTTVDHHHLVAAHLMPFGQNAAGFSPDQPMQTVLAGATRFAEVRAFLIKYFGTDQDPRLDEPMHTVTTKDRFGLVTVAGEDYQIIDIGMRMLTPRELYRAQGFPDDYGIDVEINGRRLSKAAQVRMCGNSVCPPVAAALVRANFAHEAAWRIAA